MTCSSRLARRIRLLSVVILAATPVGAGAAGTEDGPRALLGAVTPATASQGGDGWFTLSTAPSARAAGSVGINLDTWSYKGAYTFDRWPNLMAKLKASGIRRARVDVHLVSGDWGTQRQIEMGKAGFKLNVELGDAFGRYSATPFDRVYDVFRQNLLPYAEAVEGTNEPDLAKVDGWPAIARTHQGLIVDALKTTPGGDRIAVFAPPTGRPNNQAALGDLTGLADYANAHAYPGGRYGALGYDSFLPPASRMLPGGPVVVTETGVHTSPDGTYTQPGVSEDVQARYTPKLVLEALRRGIPRTYLFDLVDRFDDPDLVRVEAHFGLLRVDGTPKPAYGAVSRLMSELQDPGDPARVTRPLRFKVHSGTMPSDLRTLAFRRTDGGLELAIWRERSLWDTTAKSPIPATPVRLRLALGERYLLARTRQLATGAVAYQVPLLQQGGLDLRIGDDVTMVRLVGKLG